MAYLQDEGKRSLCRGQKECQTLTAVPVDARWEPISLEGVLNADVRDVYKQKYLSPRVQTCSNKLRQMDFPTGQHSSQLCLPAIDLANVPGLLGEKNVLKTPQGVPFIWPGEGQNIAFTTQYDNFPNAIKVPVGRAAAPRGSLWRARHTTFRKRLPMLS